VHSRTQSLGTTKSSPSTRNRSLEDTMSLIHGALEGKGFPESPTGGDDDDDDDDQRPHAL
jgi:serine/threonine-protein phosphatase 2B catalytic subunit